MSEEKRCKWCEDPIESHEETQRCEHGDLYHQDCHYDMLCEYRQEQFMKHAPDNMR